MHISNLIELSISVVLEILLVGLLLRRRAHRLFPIFFTFTALEALALTARLLVITRYHAYFYIYWSTEAVLLPLSLAALHEVFHWMFEGFYRLWWFRLFYYGTIAAVLAVGIRNAFVSPPFQAHPLITLILDVTIAVNFVRMGLVSLFIVLHRLLMMDFRRYAYGIVVGFGISSAGPLLVYLAFSVFGTKLETLTRIVPAVAYILGVAIWVASFIRPEPEEKEWKPPMSPDQMAQEVQGYLRTLGVSRRKG